MYLWLIRILAKPVILTRRKSSCPYKEELFRCLDWTGYRNDLQRWRKEYKLFPVPKVILPCKEYRKPFIDNDISQFPKKEEKHIYAKHPEETDVKELQKIVDQQGKK